MRIIDSHTHPFGNRSLHLETLIRSRRDAVLLRLTHPEVFAQVWDNPEDLTDQLLLDMDVAGIEMALIQSPPGAPADFFADAIRSHPDRFIGISSINAPISHQYDRGVVVNEVNGALDQFEKALTYQVRTMGFRGVGEGVNYAFSQAIAPDQVARDLFPVMEIIAGLGIPVMFSTAWNQFGKPIHKGIPYFVDDLAIQFPKVPIILTKMGRGYDFIFEVCLCIAFKHLNVYLDTVQAPAKHINRAVNEIGADRVMYGSDWDTTWRALGEHSGMGLYRNTLDEIENAELTSEQRSAVLGGTAVQLYGLP